jgi:hypothetical protein
MFVEDKQTGSAVGRQVVGATTGMATTVCTDAMPIDGSHSGSKAKAKGAKAKGKGAKACAESCG